MLDVKAILWLENYLQVGEDGKGEWDLGKAAVFIRSLETQSWFFGDAPLKLRVLPGA